MMVSQIRITPHGLLVKSTARDFPSLADLEPFIDLRPIGLAPRVGAQLDSIPVVGRAA